MCFWPQKQRSRTSLEFLSWFPKFYYRDSCWWQKMLFLNSQDEATRIELNRKNIQGPFRIIALHAYFLDDRFLFFFLTYSIRFPTNINSLSSLLRGASHLASCIESRTMDSIFAHLLGTSCWSSCIRYLDDHWWQKVLFLNSRGEAIKSEQVSHNHVWKAFLIFSHHAYSLLH